MTECSRARTVFVRLGVTTRRNAMRGIRASQCARIAAVAAGLALVGCSSVDDALFGGAPGGSAPAAPAASFSASSQSAAAPAPPSAETPPPEAQEAPQPV